ncbi:MAG: CHAT domain-containing protein [Chloroflexales bacterium]
MNDPADLELSLRRRDAVRYTVDLIFSQPGSEADVRPLGQQSVCVTFEMDRLREMALDPVGYGRVLTEMLLRDPALASAFAQCRTAAQSQRMSLRLRLAIAPDAPELHAIRWETLRDPQSDQPLALSEQLLLTRALGSADWQPVTLRAKGDLRALVVIAAPAGLDRFNLAHIDADVERQVALTGMSEIPATVLAAPGQSSLPTLIRHLRDGYDILYLVAHGTVVDGEPRLFLDDGQGQVACIPGADVVARIADLPIRPRLVLLSSCQSAGDGSRDALASLGPRLATAGIPAVIAMQGSLSIATNTTFAPAFFRELHRDGRIDRALAAARQTIADRPDWWVPALFTRLHSGRIWYEPGFDAQDFAKWPALVGSIAHGKCTPILGPGLLDGFIGSTRDVAHRLATKHHFPLAPFARDDLPQVAQYLAVKQDADLLRDEMDRAFRVALAAHASVPPVAEDSLDAQVRTVGACRRANDAGEPYRVLASLPLPIFLTANPDGLLADALSEAQKTPQVVICPWNRHGELNQSPITPPTRDHPLVYHLFGRLDDPESLVLTEDDYFRYLIGVTRNEELLPKVVGSALVNTALLFLGFRLDDWNFRVLFQSVMNLAGSELRRRYTHVAVQIDPQEGAMLDPQAAREYLKNYFGPAAALNYQTNISIYWGSAEDFIRELAEHYARSQEDV